MGSESSKIEDVFDALYLADQSQREKAMKTLRDANDKYTIQNIVDPRNKMNALMATLRTLKLPNRVRIAWAEDHYKDFDMNHIGTLKAGNGEQENQVTVLHLLAMEAGACDSEIRKRVSHLVAKMLQHGADPSILDSKERNPLMYAAQNGDEYMVREICNTKQGAETVNVVNKAGESPLLFAIQNGNATIISKILNKTSNENGMKTVVHPITKMNALMILVQGLSMNDRIEACDRHFRDFDMNHVSEYLDAQQQFKNRVSLLHLLLATGPHLEQATIKKMADLVEKMIAEGGANPSLLDSNEVSPLMIAAENRLELVVNELCGAGAEVNFLNRQGKSPLLSAIRGGNLHCISRILSLCKAEVKKNHYYDNLGAAYEQAENNNNPSSSSPSTSTSRERADRPLEIAGKNQDIDTFEFLLKNNFDLSEWSLLKGLIQSYKSKKNNPYDKYFVNQPTSVATKNDIGNDFDGAKILYNCAGNALAQACLIRNLPVFTLLVDQFDPRLPYDILHHSSILHLIASFKVDTSQKSDKAIDFVDVVREKCCKYHPEGKYDWFIFDNKNDGQKKRTPLDYCIAANEPSSEQVTSDQCNRLAAYRTRDQDDAARKRVRLNVGKAYTALIFIETLKHIDLHLDQVDFEEIHIVINNGDSDVLEVLNVTPHVLLEKITKITIENCDFDSANLCQLQGFTKLEELVIFHMKKEIDVNGFLGDHFAENKQARTNPSRIFLPTLKKMSIANTKVSGLQRFKDGTFKREGLEIDIQP